MLENSLTIPQSLKYKLCQIRVPRSLIFAWLPCVGEYTLGFLRVGLVYTCFLSIIINFPFHLKKYSILDNKLYIILPNAFYFLVIWISYLSQINHYYFLFSFICFKFISTSANSTSIPSLNWLPSTLNSLVSHSF